MSVIETARWSAENGEFEAIATGAGKQGKGETLMSSRTTGQPGLWRGENDKQVSRTCWTLRTTKRGFPIPNLLQSHLSVTETSLTRICHPFSCRVSQSATQTAERIVGRERVTRWGIVAAYARSCPVHNTRTRKETVGIPSMARLSHVHCLRCAPTCTRSRITSVVARM
jgi:hypothetical protein